MMKDLVCGTFAGVFMTLSGHPFDSIKVRMQTSVKTLSLQECVRSILKNEGFFSLYRGLTPPLCTIPMVNAIVMSSYELWKRILGVESEELFTFKQSVCSGMFAGFVNSFVISPVELVKCRLQVQTESAKTAYYKGPIDCCNKIISEEGLRVLMTSGLIATIFRETCCYAGQFGGYYLTKRGMAKMQGCKLEELGHFSLFLSGGIGGLSWWLSSYPQDIVKTKLQTQKFGQVLYPRHSYIPDEGIISCSKTIWAKDGFFGFWRGFSAWAIRAFCANGFMFMAYEFAMNKYDDFRDRE